MVIARGPRERRRAMDGRVAEEAKGRWAQKGDGGQRERVSW